MASQFRVSKENGEFFSEAQANINRYRCQQQQQQKTYLLKIFTKGVLSSLKKQFQVVHFYFSATWLDKKNRFFALVGSIKKKQNKKTKTSRLLIF